MGKKGQREIGIKGKGGKEDENREVGEKMKKKEDIE